MNHWVTVPGSRPNSARSSASNAPAGWGKQPAEKLKRRSYFWGFEVSWRWMFQQIAPKELWILLLELRLQLRLSILIWSFFKIDRICFYLFTDNWAAKKTIPLNQRCFQWISMGELHNLSKVKSPFWVVAKWSFYSTPSIDHPRSEARIATGFCSHVKTSVRESPGDKMGGCWVFQVFFHGFLVWKFANFWKSKVQEPALSALLDRMWLHKFLVEATEATGMVLGVVITLARWAKFR